MIQYINNKKTTVIYNNNKFTRNRINVESTNYVCTTPKCNATITTQDGVIILQNIKHCHDPMTDCEAFYLIETTKIKDELEQNADIDARKKHEQLHESMRRLYSREEIAEIFQPWQKVKSTYWRHSKKSKPVINPDTNFVNDLPKLANGEQFAQYDNQRPENRIIILMSNSACEILSKSVQWHFDGTFKSVPKMFTQLLNISCNYKEKMFRCAFILLPNKERTTYIEAITKLKEIILLKNRLTISVKFIVTDFEYSLQQALQCLFDNIQIKGCWFHFNQAIIKKVTNLGLRPLYRVNHDFKLWIRRFGALPLIPLDKLEEAWNIILDTIPVQITDNILKFILYFFNTWLAGKNGANKVPSIWNFYDHEGPRTNNNLEGFHSVTNKRLSCHPDVYQLVEYLKTVDSTNVDLFVKMNQGRSIKHVNKRVEKFHEELAIIQEEFKRKFISFDDYFYRLTHHVTYSKYVDENDENIAAEHEFNVEKHENEYESIYKSSDRRLEDIHHRYSSETFLKRLDIKNKTIIPRLSQSLESSQLLESPHAHIFTDEQFLLFKAQFLCYKNMIVLYQTVDPKLVAFSTCNKFRPDLPPKKRRHNINVPQVEKINETKKIDNNDIQQVENDNNDVEYLTTIDIDVSNNKRVYRVELNDTEWLDAIHIEAFQTLIRNKYNIAGLFHPGRYLDSNYQNSYWNPDEIHLSPFVQVLHAGNHWVTISNYNPWYCPEQPLGLWFIYDSLNNPSHYINEIKPALKRLNVNSREITVIHSRVVNQKGFDDCGLFALGYALALVQDVNPSTLLFDQHLMRKEYNFMIKNNSCFLFSHSVLYDSVIYTSYDVDLSDVNLILN